MYGSRNGAPIYLDLRQLIGHPDLLTIAARAYGHIVRSLSADRLAGVPTAALPLATAVSLQGGWPMIYSRSVVKDYGTRSAIEGPWQAGDRVVVLDDVATSGGSILGAVHALREAGLVVTDAVVLIDRLAGAEQALAQEGVRLHAVYRLTDLVEQWRAAGRIAPSQVEEIRSFLESTA